MSLRSLLLRALAILLPPRESERVISKLTHSALASLRNTRGVGILPYQDTRVRALVWELKYYANKEAQILAGLLLAEEVIAIASEHIGTPLLIPIPMHPKRRRERGHNQTELLCKAALVHTGSGFEYAPHALLRTVHTAAQQGLPRHARLKNAHRTIQVENPALIRGRVCIVVDDVSTTGATVAEATRALMLAGAGSVTCVALAS